MVQAAGEGDPVRQRRPGRLQVAVRDGVQERRELRQLTPVLGARGARGGQVLTRNNPK